MLLDATNDANLIKVLKFKDAKTHYLLKLFYNDDTVATNFVGVSDDDRTVSSVSYIGIVRSWGSLHQSADIIEFTSSTGMATIILDNTTHAILGDRFTDLFATKNFVNRKWELYLESDAQLSTSPICSGIISADIKADPKQITINLLNYESKFNLQIPATVVDSTTYPNAPDENIDKPIPQTYGGFDRKSATGSPMHYDYAWVYGHFPAIITNKQTLIAKPDSQAVKTIRTRNLYMVSQGRYIVCDDGSVTATAATAVFTFTGDVWYIAWPIIKDDSSMGNLWDEDIATSGVLASEADGEPKTYIFDLPQMENVGIYKAIYINFDYSAKSDPGSGAGIEVFYQANSTDGYGSSTAKSLVSMSADFALSPGASKLPGMGAKVKIIVTGDTAGNTLGSVTCLELTVVFKVQPTDTFVRSIERKIVTGSRLDLAWDEWNYGFDRWKVYRTVLSTERKNKEFLSPANISYVYCSGEGRMFGTWIDTIDATARATYTGKTDPGYAANDLTENPIYIAEEALRTEGGLDEDDIDLATFDVSGNTTDGLIKEVFTGTVANIKFAFSQYNFTDIISFIERIGKQCGTLFFISGSGKIKSATRLRPGDYSAGDEVLEINYDDLSNINYWRTPIGAVRNNITVKYAYDYAREELIESVNPAADATSYGSGLTGYNQQLYLEEGMDCCLDAVTADNYADALLAWHKDRHNIISFGTSNPRYQALEIGDVVEFLNWDSDFKVYGATPTTTDLFMVISVTRNGPSRMQFILMEVS